MTDILSTYPTFIVANDLAALSTAFNARQGQLFLSSLTAGDFEPESVAFARLLLAYGDVSIQDLAKTIEQPTSRHIMQQLLQLLSCAGYAGAEDEICTPALEFWQSFTEYLIDTQFDEDNQHDTWMNSARQYVVQAIDLCWAKLRIPPQEVLAQWDSDAKGDFKAFRADVEDLLQSSYTLLGVNIFDQLAVLALKSLNSHAWLHLEATLFCLNALAESVSDEDSVDQTLSRIFGSSLFSAMMDPLLSIPSKTQQTAVTLITSYTAFFERHTPFLPSMLTFLFGSLKIPALSGVAAKAIYSTCDSCRASLVSEIEAFLQQYMNILTWEDVESITKERVIGGIAAIIQAVSNSEQQCNGLSRLLDFVGQDVEVCTALLAAGALEESQAEGLCALRSLVNIGKSFQEPDDVTIDLEVDGAGPRVWDVGTWGSLQQRIVRYVQTIMSMFSREGDIIEASCQILRTGYKETFAGPFVFPPNITEDLVVSSNIETARLEYILDTAGAMLSRHTSRSATRVDGAATTFLIHILTLIASMNCKQSIPAKVGDHNSQAV